MLTLLESTLTKNRGRGHGATTDYPLLTTHYLLCSHIDAHSAPVTPLFATDSSKTGEGEGGAKLRLQSRFTLQPGLPPARPDATIWCSMNPAMTQDHQSQRPRVGVPWRTSAEQRANIREKLEYYFQAIRAAGAEPQEISLVQSPEELEAQLINFDAFVLPGSPADVDPNRYGAAKHIKTQNLDPSRDATDTAILGHALQSSKPVLAICYGCQILNVFAKGTLIQDIRAQKPDAGSHGTTDLPSGVVHGDVKHQATLTPGSRLASLNQAEVAEINSSHHQAIDQPGKNLKVTARAADGIIEGVEWTGDSNWVVGVQWHPERMPGDAFSERLFSDFVAAARSARGAVAQNTEAG